MICAMAAHYKRLNKSLLQVLDELRKEYGFYAERLQSFQFQGADGAEKMTAIMKRMRDTPPKAIGGIAVSETVDHMCPERTKLPKSDVLVFRLESGDRVTVRPSGTEPKMKVYLSVKRKTQEEVNRAVEEMGEAVKELIVGETDKKSAQNNRRRESIVQFIKFCMVGASSAVVNLAVYYLIVLINNKLYLVANVLGWIVSVLNAFFWNNRLVFSGGEQDWRSIGKRLLRTYVSYAATMLLATVLLHFEVQVWGISEFIAPLINICVTTPINFVANKFWTFAH